MEDFELPENVPIGSRIFGRFTVVERVGIGTTGVVYACARDYEEELLAIKILSYKASLDKNLTFRFRNEIHASYSVTHPNVIRAYEFYRDEERMGYSMEFADAGNFEELLKAKPVLALPGVVQLLIQLAEGTKAIHASGLVHRDIKPSNILLTSRGEVKISDFTTAFDCRAEESRNEIGAIGTLEYMSPEVITTGRADYRSDIYSLGVVAYQAVTGRLPFAHQDESELIKLISNKKKLDNPQLLRTDCPPWLSKFIMKALSRDPKKRQQTMDEVLRELRNPDDASPKGLFSRVLGLGA